MRIPWKLFIIATVSSSLLGLATSAAQTLTLDEASQSQTRTIESLNKARNPNWCESLFWYKLWIEKTATQPGPTSSLTPAQKNYYKGVKKKVADWRRKAIRQINLDNRKLAQDLARNVAFLGTFEDGLPAIERAKYAEAAEQVSATIKSQCGGLDIVIF